MLCLGLEADPLRAAFINGHSYVPMADWAQVNGLKVAWDKRARRAVVSNSSIRLGFEVDSAQVTVNGIAVRLCFPTASDRSGPLISQLDADKTIRPFLYPPRNATGRRITTVCLDPGHGGKDTGNRVGSNNEKTYTLALALELRSQLQQAGFKVLLTRSKDTFIDLPVRPAIANQHGADLFVSLHFNATQEGRNDVWGPETYCITPVGASSSNAEGEGASYGPTTANHYEQKSLLLAYEEQKSLVRSLGTPDRGVRRARFAVLRDAAMPAILIEGGYMTHPREGPRIFDAGYRRMMARAILNGILAYVRITESAMPVAAHPSHTAGNRAGRRVHTQ